MKKLLKNLSTLTAFILSGAMLLTPVMAESKTTTTGGVSIDLKTYTSSTANGTRYEESNFDGLLPGEVKNYYINITNQAFPAYVRVKVIYNSTFSIENIDNILGGISDDWVKTNGYYYYKKALKQNESVDLCKTFKTPDLENGMNNEINLSISADAIQEKNFSPNFDAEDPWGGQQIEATREIGEIYADERSYPINYDNNLTVSDKAVFKIKGNPMPGDVYNDKLTIKPSVNGTIHVKAIYNDKDFPKEANLVRLSITNDNTKYYEGSLFSNELENGFDIKDVKADTKYTLDLRLSLDAALVNVSEWTKLPVAFYITLTEEKVEEPKPTPTPSPSAPAPSVTKTKPSVINITLNEGDNVFNNYITEPAGVLGATLQDIPDQGVLGAIRDNILTGDNAMPVLVFLIGCTAIIAAIMTGTVMVVKKRRGSHEA